MKPGWKSYCFSEVTRIASGLVDPKKMPYCNYPHVGPENIEIDSGKLSNIQTVSELNLISGKYLFDEHAIVYSKIRPNLNKVCHPGFVGLCSADAYVIWVNETIVDRDYLLHAMRSPAFVEQAVAVSMRTGMPKINQSDLNRLTLPLPSLDEQRAISSIFSVWDRGIGQLSDLIATKLRFKQGLMQQLLTGKWRHLEFKDDWRDYHLGDLFIERDEKDRVDLPLLSITADRGVIPRDDVDRKDTSSENKSLYKRIAPGDIGYNTMRMWQGVSAVSQWEGIVSPAYTICIPTDKINADFAGYLFKFSPTIQLFHRFSQGLVNDTLNLKYHHFSQVQVRIPQVAEQRRIVEILYLVDHEIDLLRKQLAVVKEQKKGLMQKLLTGELKI